MQEIKRYLITGATSGIGKVCAQQLLQKGHECYILGRNKAILNEFSEEYPETTTPIKVDLTNYESIKNFIDKINLNSTFDGFIHCAGIAPLKKIEENEPEIVLQTYMVNTFSFIEIIRLLFNKNLLKNDASIVAISSVTAHKGSNRQSIYSGTKAALEASIRCMAKEFISKKTKIRVNSIVSGTVETDMLKKLRENSPGLNDKLIVSYPLGVINPENIYKMVEYLLSDSSINITGASMQLDSGFLL
jgi:NAD(P)-dependent dehydrogenase (short-subunit alcohol dehydrogenase family)